MVTKKTVKSDDSEDLASVARPKRASRAKPAAASAPVTVPVAVADIEAAETEAAVGPAVVTMRRKELIERVAELTGGKKKDLREIVEAVLEVLGEALTKGEELNLPPLGKAKVNRQRDLTSGQVLIVKLRRPGPGGDSATSPLADEPE